MCPPERRQQLIEAVNGMESSFLHLPTKELPPLLDGLADYYYDWLAHPEYDDYWKALCIEDNHSRLSVPACNIGGWYDIFLGGTIRNFLGMRANGGTDDARRGQKLLIGPWQHSSRGASVVGNHYFGLAADAMAADLDGVHLRWFDYWLKGIDNGILDAPPSPHLRHGRQRLAGRAGMAAGQGAEHRLLLPQWWQGQLPSWGRRVERPAAGRGTARRLPVQPGRPRTPTRGGALCCNPYFAANGAFDQRDIEARPDVLVYTTPPLEQDLEVTGPVTVSLWAATSAADTDFTAKLVDVCEDGCARNLTDGIIRARYRESALQASMVEPGRAYLYTIDLWATSNVFQRGHRIRVEISSSNFPRFDRNTNTGNVIAGDATFKPALQTVLHDAQHPSHITLPVVPR